MARSRAVQALIRHHFGASLEWQKSGGINHDFCSSQAYAQKIFASWRANDEQVFFVHQAGCGRINYCVCVSLGDVLLRAFLQCLPSRCSCCLLSLRWREFCCCHADVLFGVAVAVPSTFRGRGCCATPREFYSPQKFARRLCWEFTMRFLEFRKIH